MKNNPMIRDLIFVQMNHAEHYALTYGIEFIEFMHTFSDRIPNILLIRHQFQDGHFHMNTKFDYVNQENIKRLVTDDVYQYGDFCWLDFDEEEKLDLLSNEEIAELLFLGHMKNHLRIPFYGKLSNQFAYLAFEDGLLNKTYYKSGEDFYRVLGTSIAMKLNVNHPKRIFGFRNKKLIPPVPNEILHPFLDHMKEGIVFSIEKAAKNRSQIEIPVWIMEDSYDMDNMYEEYELLGDRAPDGKIVFNRKSREWQAMANYNIHS